MMTGQGRLASRCGPAISAPWACGRPLPHDAWAAALQLVSVRGLGAAVAVAALLLGAGAAWGHAFLERAEPRAGSTVKIAPSQVRAWFTEALEPAFSTLEVVNERGERVDRGPAQVDALSPALLQVPLRPLGPGTYRVKWRVLSVDTHVTEGDFTFRVTGAP